MVFLLIHNQNHSRRVLDGAGIDTTTVPFVDINEMQPCSNDFLLLSLPARTSLTGVALTRCICLVSVTFCSNAQQLDTDLKMLRQQQKNKKSNCCNVKHAVNRITAHTLSRK